jgi:hypothetical protein
MTAVVSAIVIYAIGYQWLSRREKKLEKHHTIKEIETEPVAARENESDVKVS